MVTSGGEWKKSQQLREERDFAAAQSKRYERINEGLRVDLEAQKKTIEGLEKFKDSERRFADLTAERDLLKE